MPHKYKDPSTGRTRNLTEDEEANFDYLLLILAPDYEEYEFKEVQQVLKEMPHLVYMLEDGTNLTALHYAVNNLSLKGKECVNLLLQKGASVFQQSNNDVSSLDKIKHMKNPQYKKIFLDLFYKYAQTQEARLEIDPARATAEYTEARAGDIKTAKKFSGFEETKGSSGSSPDKKEGKCTISILHKVIYDNDLFNHPKIQKMLELAKQKSMINELIDLGQDKDISDAITSAISETKHKMFNELFPNGVEDEQILAEINSQLEDLSIEQVLDILLAQAPLSEPEIATPQQMIATTKQDSALAHAYEFIQTVFENLEGLIDAAKLLEMLNFITQTSGNQFISGFHGGNPDDHFDGNNGGGTGIVLDNNTPQNQNPIIHEAIPVIGNYTILMPQNFIEVAM